MNFDGITISLSESKQISKLDSMLQLLGSSRLTELIDKYAFLQSLTEKSVMIAQQVLLLRKQIVMIIVLYKTVDIMMNAYREYKQLKVY